MTAQNLVLEATNALFNERDSLAVDRYWSPSYVEHATVLGAGVDGLREVPGRLPAGFRHDRPRVFSEDGLVVAHGLDHGFGPYPTVGCDLWRVEDAKIVEHWDAHQQWVEPTVSGHSMVDGPTDVTEPDQTAASRSLVEEFVDLIMIGRDRSQIVRFFDGDRFIQHNPEIADGVSGLGSAIQSGVWAATVTRVHRIVTDGEFVFTQSEGVLHGRPTVFYDIFRVERGRLAEHWDVVYPEPDQLPHDNGLF
jgi:predicted SnoaL-like aldol condensation-catalyzing enzyme